MLYYLARVTLILITIPTLRNSTIECLLNLMPPQENLN